MNKSRFLGQCLILALAATCITAIASAQDKSEEKPTFASVLDQQLSQTEKTVVPAADAMPEDKYNFVPTQGDFKGVRGYGAEVKHVAQGNFGLAAAILGEKPPIASNGPNGPDSAQSKADIMKLLNDSYVYAHKAINSITDANVLEPVKAPFGGAGTTTRLALATRLIAHPYDHYGQMVEYLRMNNIIPPASRK